MDARLLARDHCVEAVKKLISIMNNPKATHTAQLIAANSILIAATAGRPSLWRFTAPMFRPTAETMFSKLSKADLLSLASVSERKDFYRGQTDPEMLRCSTSGASGAGQCADAARRLVRLDDPDGARVEQDAHRDREHQPHGQGPDAAHRCARRTGRDEQQTPRSTCAP
jgi:hypothetical protein